MTKENVKLVTKVLTDVSELTNEVKKFIKSMDSSMVPEKRVKFEDYSEQR